MKHSDANILVAEKIIDVRFNEVDAVGIAWHGSYAIYFEEARAAFGAKYGLEYSRIYDSGYYAPITEIHFNFKRFLKYLDRIRVVITYRPCEAARLIFDYEIFNCATNELIATGNSVQVFLNREFQLVFTSPDFYKEWKCKNGVL